MTAESSLRAASRLVDAGHAQVATFVSSVDAVEKQFLEPFGQGFSADAGSAEKVVTVANVEATAARRERTWLIGTLYADAATAEQTKRAARSIILLGREAV